MKYFYILLIVSLCFNKSLCFFDPLSWGIIGGISSGLYYIPASLKKYTICKAFECCDETYITPRFNELKLSLEQKLYGQHLAEQVVVTALTAHFNKHPQKALTLSFHGWQGSGKNYITKFIVESLYKEGFKSDFVHFFNSRIHFPLASHAERYKSDLQNWIKGNITQCEQSLFIFDEVDKMPPGVLNAIKPLIDYNDYIDKINYKKAIFIFISNTGATIINDHYIKLWEKGRKRKDIELRDFENLIAKGAFNEEGGFQYSDAIKNSLIDHYIPFFPMEKEHVEMCIKDQFHLRGVRYPTQQHIEEVMNIMEWGPAPINLFSTTGCKRISQKVSLVIKNIGIVIEQPPVFAVGTRVEKPVTVKLFDKTKYDFKCVLTVFKQQTPT